MECRRGGVNRCHTYREAVLLQQGVQQFSHQHALVCSTRVFLQPAEVVAEVAAHLWGPPWQVCTSGGGARCGHGQLASTPEHIWPIQAPVRGSWAASH